MADHVVDTSVLLETARRHDVEFDTDGHAVLPPDLALVIHDRADRKFVAVALADEGRSTIVNAVDSDWHGWQEALSQEGIVVEQLLDRQSDRRAPPR